MAKCSIETSIDVFFSFVSHLMRNLSFLLFFFFFFSVIVIVLRCVIDEEICFMFVKKMECELIMCPCLFLSFLRESMCMQIRFELRNTHQLVFLRKRKRREKMTRRAAVEREKNFLASVFVFVNSDRIKIIPFACTNNDACMCLCVGRSKNCSDNVRKISRPSLGRRCDIVNKEQNHLSPLFISM